MQVSPSASLFQVLSSLFQPGAARAQGAEATARPEGIQAARTPALPKPEPAQSPVSFEAPAPGTPIRRGMLINILT